MARKQILTPVVLPLLASGFLFLAIIPLTRLITSYRALALGFDAQVVGMISAAYALLPVLIAVQIGRFNDRGGARISVVAGALSVLAAGLVLAFGPETLATLIAGSAFLGVGQTMGLSALQIILSRSASRSHRDTLLGNYMVLLSMGQAVGPLAIGLTDNHQILLYATSATALVLVGLAATLSGVVPKAMARKSRRKIPVASVLRTPGLTWIIVTGSFCVAAQDFLLAFLPVFGEERGISPFMIGALLSIRAVGAMVSRAMFGPMVRRFGRVRLFLAALLIAGVSLLSLAIEMPLPLVILAFAAIGFGIGISLTSSMALTMSFAPVDVRGTALSLRLTANRMGQFGLSLVAGATVATLDAGSVFGLSGAALLVAFFRRPEMFSGRRPAPDG